MPLETRAAVRAPQQKAPPSYRDLNRLPPASTREERGPASRRAPPSIPPVVASVPSPKPVLPVRLRYVALLIGAGLTLRSLGLSALAYWQLHEAAAQLANYAVCMAGPTGPQALREHPEDFWRMVRRRVVAAPSEARPFAPCVPALRAYAGEAQRPAHEARASDFSEYASLRASAKPAFDVNDLTVSVERLTTLAAAAWPFSPSSMADLLRPERSAKPASHPAAPPLAARGRGLPAAEVGYSALRASDSSLALVAGQGANVGGYRSDDGGSSWATVDIDDPALAALSGQCSSADGKARFSLRHTSDQLRVDSYLNGEVETSFPLSTADSTLASFACDGAAALAVLREDAEPRVQFRICPHQAPCRNLSVPPLLRAVPDPRAAFSVARVKGAAVISMALSGVVRVISSRDDGETWTPPVVAFDREEQGREESGRLGSAVPTHLLSLGSKLMLYAGGRGPSEPYPVLFSNDFGVSWQER